MVNIQLGVMTIVIVTVANIQRLCKQVGLTLEVLASMFLFQNSFLGCPSWRGDSLPSARSLLKTLGWGWVWTAGGPVHGHISEAGTSLGT